MSNKKIEKNKKRSTKHPFFTFILLIIGVILISSIASLLDIQATYIKINPVTGELEPYIITVTSLLNRTGLRYMISEATRNFIIFAPFIISLMLLVAFGVLEESGFLKAIITKLTNKMSKKLITFLLFVLGIVLNVFMETAYLIVIPLGAVLFLFNGRNPLVGVVAGFSSVAFGFGINVFSTPLDISLIHYTNMAARVIDQRYQVEQNSNLYIMIFSIILLAWVGTYITEKIIVKKLGRYIVEEENKDDVIENSRKGFIYASITFIIVTIIYLYMLIPGLPFSGLLLDYTEIDYIKQLYGVNSYFQDSIPFLISILFIVTGITYGIGAKTYKNDKDIVDAMGKYTKILGDIVILTFVASQFIAYFRKTNLGTIISAWGAELIKNSQFSGIPLIVLMILVIAIVNLFQTSTVIKWSIMSSVLIPTLMQLNITPEFSQMMLRAGDSISNGITPLLAYFVVFVAFLNYYNKKAEPITIKKSLSFTMPYSIAYTALWIIILVSWYIIGLPLGPHIYPTV